MKPLFIYYEDRKVGLLQVDEQGSYSFRYEKNWLTSTESFPLSLSLPLSDEVFGNKLTLSFFENLLPEGDVRVQIEKSRGIYGAYNFLKNFGKDCAGAVTVLAQEIEPADFKIDYAELTVAEIDKAISEKRSVSALISSINPGYLSIAGAQDKFVCVFKNNKFYLPMAMTPTTHIVKIPILRNGIRQSVYNEYYCMSLAKTVGFNIPHFFIFSKAKHPFFVIERYDRCIDSDGVIKRIHQQDFCQAKGLMSGSKYEVDGGPSIKDNYELIQNNVSVHKRFDNLNSYLEWISFNLIIGNNDSHSKNISLLMSHGIELAPFYDMLCTEVYPNLTKRFSFLVGGRNEVDQIGKNQFEVLNQQLGIRKGAFQESFSKILDSVEKSYVLVADQVKSEFPDCKITTGIQDLIKIRLRSFRKRM
ncbi:MAG: type II toxin-antitoxin system HipA family toxin [Bdellovibrionaceae bacterium]|nr:type II toxin-antitoxin system HipA family toxin [Pseudobdellovibrionaceae bacterium]